MKYLAYHNASSFKVGDVVRVYTACESFASDWEGVWTPGMDSYVGKTGTIVVDYQEGGFGVRVAGVTKSSEPYGFPFFVLEPVSSSPCVDKEDPHAGQIFNPIDGQWRFL